MGSHLYPAGWHSHHWYLLKDQEYEFRRTRVSSGKWYCPISLSEGKSELLKLKRFELKHSLKDILWGKKRFVSELEMNQHLAGGPDFAGDEKRRYLPALQRYRSKFYVQGLGGAPEAEQAL